MTELRNAAIAVVALVVAFLLQIVVAPYIVIGNAMPNFAVAVVLGCAVVNRDVPVYPIAFFAGFGYAFLCGGIVGALAAMLIIACFLSALLLTAFGNESPLFAIIAILVCALVVNIGVAFIQCMLGYSGSLFDAIVMCALPCGIYDTIFAVIVYFLMHSLLKETASVMNLNTPNFR